MRGFYRELWKNERGNTIILTALFIVLLLGFVAVVIDGGTIYAAKRHLQKTANAAVLSGAQELTNNETSVRTVVHEILTDHQESDSLINTQVVMHHKVSITLRKEVSLGFARVLGFSTAPVEAKATAEILTMGRAMGAAPLGIDERVPLVFNQEYTLKVDETGVEQGYFGVLGLGGTGASTYEYNLINGYQNELKVGDILETETGNIAGKTRTGINTRIQRCPYPDGDYTHRDCSRIILIPVYKPYLHEDGKQLKKVEITGFAYFYISKPMSSNDTSIRGKFIERAGTGFVSADAVHRGAYAIRLTE